MEAARKFIQIVRFVFLGVVVLYALLVLRLPSSATPDLVILRAITVVAVSQVVLIFVMRKIHVSPAEAVLGKRPEDTKALARWRKGYIVIYAISLSIVLYGVALHFLGFSVAQVAPFFLAGFALILFFRPRVTPNNASPAQSAPITPR